MKQSFSKQYQTKIMAAAALKKMTLEVEKVTKGLENANRKGKKKKAGDEDLDATAITNLVFNLKNALEQLIAFVGKEDNFCPKIKEQEKRTRHLEDQTDDLHQKSLIGSFVITSKANDDLESLITPEKELKEPLVSHVQTLCLTKLNVTLPREEIQSCHYLPDGSIKLSLANLSLDSAFDKMVTEIKNPGEERKKTNLYFNFMLTRRRNGLLYEVRKLKRAGDIHKFWTDYNGAITVKKDATSPKLKLTAITNKRDETLRTYTAKEVKEEFAKK